MRPDTIATRTFLSRLPPFDALPDDALEACADAASVRRLAAGAVLHRAGEPVEALHIVASGALEAVAPDGQLLSRIGEGEAVGVQSLLSGGVARATVTAIEDTVLHAVPAALFHRLRAAHPALAAFFAPHGADRLRRAGAVAAGPEGAPLTARRVGDLVRRAPVTVQPGASVADAVLLMEQFDVSCLPVVEAGRLVGILTDRDLRNRVLAGGRPVEAPVATVMTADPIRVEADAWLFQAQILMLRNRLHHLPVLRDGSLAGVVTSTDLLRTHLRSVVFLAGEIGEQEGAEGIAGALQGLPGMVQDLVEGGSGAYAIGHAVSCLADAATLRLIELAQRRLGPAPVPYLWLALGSQGRNEQTARTDQDNALILDDGYDPAAHGAWFAAFADFVCDGLATAGYVHCPGLIMAKTPAWRMTLTAWRRTFARWIDEPDPAALLNASVFFDMRPVAGDATLFERLQEPVLARAKGAGLFLAHLAGNAMTHQPPLGLFRNLVLISGGEHHRSLDMKLSGLVPIVDLARVHGLAAGVAKANSRDRLAAAGEAGRLSREGARDLMDALEFLGLVRLRHQVRRMRAGRPPDNYLLPEELSPFERGHLKDAFAVVKAMQAGALATYRGGWG